MKDEEGGKLENDEKRLYTMKWEEWKRFGRSVGDLY